MKHCIYIIWGIGKLLRMHRIVLQDKLCLSRKVINLYLSFLVFADKSRSLRQLKQVMISALLSSMYDYDSDWQNGSRKGGNFNAMLKEMVLDPILRNQAFDLFKRDVAKKLSPEGLERGEIALYFYCRVIQSQWLGEYPAEQIKEFGRKLQIIDDLLDYEKDAENKHLNCLLLENRSLFLKEAREFIDGDFFSELVRRSFIYKILKRKAEATIQQLT